MSKKGGGFFDSLMKAIAMRAAVEASRDGRGRPDPCKAAGMASGAGFTSLEDRVLLCASL